MARLGHWMLLFAIILIFAENIKCEEEEEIPKISGVTRLRHEFRACQGSLEDCNDRYEECQVEKRSTDEDLQSQLTRLKGQEALAQEAKEETELVRKELIIAQDRLSVCITHTHSCEAREKTCTQDLELSRIERAAADKREAELERELRKNDCGAARRDLRTYRDISEHCAIESEALKVKLSELESKAADLPRLQSRLAAAEEARATAVAAAQAQAIDFDATKRALTAELAAKSQALQSLLQSLDTRQRYEALLAEHEQEVLPHWLSERLNSTITASKEAAAITITTATPVFISARTALSHFWANHVCPVFEIMNQALSRVPGVEEARDMLMQSMQSILSFAQRAALVTSHYASRAEAATETFIFNRLSGIPSLKRVARPELIHVWLRLACLSFLIPLSALLIRVFLSTVIYIVRSGSATVAPPLPPITTIADYKFSHIENLSAIFDAASRPRLAFLGTAVAHTLAAETAVTQMPSSVNLSFAAFEEAADRLVTSAKLAQKAASKNVALSQFVTSGPGLRSEAVVTETQAELYAACLGAAYLDSEFDIEVVRKVWCSGDGGGGGGGAVPCFNSLSIGELGGKLEGEGDDGDHVVRTNVLFHHHQQHHPVELVPLVPEIGVGSDGDEIGSAVEESVPQLSLIDVETGSDEDSEEEE